MNVLAVLAAEPTNVIEWFGSSDARRFTGSIPSQLWVTLWHSLTASAAAVVLAVPLAVVLAHYRKAELLSTWIVNIGRVVPTVTILGVALLISLRNGFGFEPWPILVALTALALPPIFANTYTAVRGVDANVVSAARAIGTTERSIMSRIELPLGLPVILTGIRVATVQVVATEVIGAFFAGEGLGVYIRQGLGNKDILQVQGGAILITGVAMMLDLGFWIATKVLVPTGVRRTRRGGRRPQGVHGEAPDPVPVRLQPQ